MPEISDFEGFPEEAIEFFADLAVNNNREWYNPRKGGKLRSGSVAQVSGGRSVDIGQPPAERGEDWLAMIRRR